MDSANDPTRETTSRRRRFLQTLGAAGLAGAAGCADLLGDDDPDDAGDDDDDDDDAESAVFLLSDLAIGAESVVQGESVDVEATLENDGGQDDGQLIELTIDGVEIASELYQVDAGGSTTVSFADADTTEVEPGENLEVAVASDDDEVTGTLTVEPANVYEVEDEPGEYTNVHHVDGGQVAGYQYLYDPAENYDDTFKTFLDIWDPNEGERITHNPRFQDVQYPHHRGIFIGWDEIEVEGTPVDNWHTAPTVHQEYDPDLDTFEETETLSSICHWYTEEDGDHFVTETREMRFRELPTEDGIVVVDCQFTLDFEMETLIDGDPEHGGIQFRAHEDEDDRREATFYFSDHWDWGENPGQGDVDNAYGYDWVSMQMRAHENDYFVTVMNHVDNPYHDETTASAYRDYGRFGMYWEDETYDPGDSVTVHYRWAIKRGGPPDGQASEIDEWFDDYVDEVDL